MPALPVYVAVTHAHRVGDDSTLSRDENRGMSKTRLSLLFRTKGWPVDPSFVAYASE